MYHFLNELKNNNILTEEKKQYWIKFSINAINKIKNFKDPMAKGMGKFLIEDIEENRKETWFIIYLFSFDLYKEFKGIHKGIDLSTVKEYSCFPEKNTIKFYFRDNTYTEINSHYLDLLNDMEMVNMKWYRKIRKKIWFYKHYYPDHIKFMWIDFKEYIKSFFKRS